MRSVSLATAIVVLFQAAPIAAQGPTATIRVQVRASEKPVENAEVVVAGTTHRTDAFGTTTVTTLPGAVELTVVKAGFSPATASVQVAAGAVREVVVELQPQPTVEETVTVVASTRTDKRLEDQPMRVEVLLREEIEEKMLMTPGDIVMMLNEMGGMRVQATSPSLGAASVRIQGMRGRYTRVLSDGLPLFGDVGGLGLLQIPPMDLGQVEVIKGVASALYGAGAMGGVINLLSRRPAAEPAREFLVNRSTRGATDAVAFLSAPFSRGWSASLLGGGHWQETTDVNEDAWADLPGTSERWYVPGCSGTGAKAARSSPRRALPTRTAPVEHPMARYFVTTGQPYREALKTRRYDAGAAGQVLINGRYVVTARASIVRQSHDHQFGEILERDRHDTVFGEVAVRGTAGRQTWVTGLAIERDAYTPRDVPQYDYTFTVPGAFVQYDVEVAPALSVSTSGRLDVHSEYGTFFSPRVSALARAGRWTGRLSVGTGFFGPTPITEETEAAGLTRLTVEHPLRAERGLSALVRPVSYRRAAVIHRDSVRIPHQRPGARGAIAVVCPQHLAGPDNERGTRALGYVAPRAILGDRDIHLRARARNRPRQ